jgi:hypothetical protein
MLTFLKPNLWKILVTVALFYASSYLWRAYTISHISDTFPRGFPFEYYMAWGPCPPGEICSEFNTLYLIIDIVIWYVVSAFLVARLRKGR